MHADPTNERTVAVDRPYRLWVTESGDPEGEPLLLVMGANASSVTWPPAFVDALGARHRVVRFDHRDTGRSTVAFDSAPYRIADLAEDCIAVLDASGIERAHVVGMSMGGILVQLLLLDHPDRLASATLFCTTALGRGLAGDGEEALPPPSPVLLDYWTTMGESRTVEDEIAWRVEHWRLLAGLDASTGDAPAFDAAEFDALERTAIAHSGRVETSTAHARAATDGLDRGDELACVRVPTLVIDAPLDPINPPPHAENLARAIGSADYVRIPELGHALTARVVPTVAARILEHTER